jgi:integrase
LAAIWLTKNETASRVRQRINTILDWAVAKGYRDAPLAMSIINKSLPKLPKGSKKHHKALPFVDVPEFMTALRDKNSIGALALQGAILNATRSSEIRLATWDEINFDKAVWTIPAERMGKRGVEHVIPLSEAALGVFEAAKAHRRGGSNLVFQGMKKGKPLSDMTLTKIVRDMGVDATVHGFRSSFKDWASETTSFANEVSEAALHHAIGNKSEAAYRRGNLLEKRRDLMEAWGGYCRLEQSKILKLVS